MMSGTLIMAFALMLIIEGLLPFLMPAAWREMFRRVIQFNDGQIRFYGLTSMVIGVLILLFAGR